ncbi:hypothetical protein HII12_002304 [Brettanomyces bruxellensis]|uniref:Phosphoribosyltransferase domain-containing protein n=1 Tax=Dekkera bruxellensis TaxID=5007 RepID=A0A8H6BJL3_DEKBR|nr:hypothetical protein HII12_002304 [Brettanomyces bruxellensis]
MVEENEKLFISYNHIHELCKEAAEKIKKLDIDYIIAIGGGGFIPARILRTFLKEPDTNTVSTTAEEVGSKVKRIQWIHYGESGIDLCNKKVLIIDEVDDTRTTLHYALSELQKDAEQQAINRGFEKSNTEFFIFVLHNKLKPKKADLPASIMDGKHYLAVRDVPDCWIAYPWESTDIAYQQKMAEKQGNDI